MNRSEARRLYWSTVPKEERTMRMSRAASIRHSSMDESEKEKLILMLQNARRNKRSN